MWSTLDSHHDRRRDITRLGCFLSVKAHHEQMLSLVFDVAIPMAIEELGKYLCLDRMAFDGFHLLLIQLIALGEGLGAELRIDGRDKGDALTIGRPNWRGRFGTDRGSVGEPRHLPCR